VLILALLATAPFAVLALLLALCSGRGVPRSPPDGSGQPVWVPGYRRRDGRRVAGHWKRR
jgi:hypothetical protein